MGGRARVIGLSGATALLLLSVFLAPAFADQPGQVVAVAPKVTVDVGGQPQTVEWVAPDAITSLTVTASSSKASIRPGLCPANPPSTTTTAPPPAATEGSTPPGSAPTVSFDLPRTDEGRFLACVGAVSAGSTIFIAIASEGSNAAIEVTVAAAPTSTVAAPPASLQLVNVHDDHAQWTIQPGFSVPQPMTATASGPTSAAYVSLASGKSTPCPTDTSTTTSGTAPNVYIDACDLDEVGSYAAKFDLNGADAAGGELAVTIVQRQPWWWAVLIAFVGTIIAVFIAWVTDKAPGWIKKSDAQTALADASDAYDRLVKVLGPDIPQWAPARWPSLQEGVPSPDPSPKEAARLYVAATAAAAKISSAADYYEKEVGAGAALVDTLRTFLDDGIALTDKELTPASLTKVLEIVGGYAAAAQAWGAETVPDADKRRKTMAAVSDYKDIPQVLAGHAVLTTSQGIEFLGVISRSSRGSRMDGSNVVNDTARGRAARRMMATRAAGAFVFLASFVGSVLLTAQDALSPTAAWGTPADIVKLAVASLTLSALLTTARKAIGGSDGSTAKA